MILINQNETENKYEILSTNQNLLNTNVQS